MAFQELYALLYLLSMAAATAVALLVGIYALLPEQSVRAVLREFIRTDWKYLGVAWLFTYGVDTIATYRVEQTFTMAVYRLEGPTVAGFQTVTVMPLTLFFSFVYLVGFPFVVLFTYFKLKAHDEDEAYRYAIAYMLLVAFALPFFVFLPVRVTAHVLPSVEPLLYELNPVIGAGIRATDSLVKAFPSLHTGLAVLAALYARKTDSRYTKLAWALALSTVLSTLYLGIHWFVDAGLAVVLVGLAYWLSQQVDNPQWSVPRGE